MCIYIHLVVVLDRTLEAIETRKKAGKSLWRVSSTLFGHMQSDQDLEPLGIHIISLSLSVYLKTLMYVYIYCDHIISMCE